MNSKIILLVLIGLLIATPVFSQAESDSSIANIKVLGVGQKTDGSYIGIIADLEVKIMDGSGHIYIDIFPLTKIDTQASTRLAKEVACSTLKMDCSKKDFFYTLRSNNPIIGGPSSGAALTVSTMAVLQGVPLKEGITITGTINPAGTIGPIGGLIEKARVARENNIHTLLIPSIQKIFINESDSSEIDLVEYGKEHLNLTIIPVEDISEAYKYMTGYQIVNDYNLNYDISSEKLNGAMKNLADSLYKDAQDTYSKTRSKLKISTITDKEEIIDLQENSLSQLEAAQSAIASGAYYSAASYSVRSAINSYTANYLLDYYTAKDNQTLLERIEEVNQTISTFQERFLTGKIIDSVDDIEIFAIVLDRLGEGEDVIYNAYQIYNEGDYETAISLLAYAEVRKNTVYSWLTLINDFTGNYSYKFNEEDIKPLALERIDQSRTSLTYSQLLLGDFSVFDSELILQNAEDSYNKGNYAYALFEAAKSRALSNLALELQLVTNDTLQEKITQAQKWAEVEIHKAQEKGLVPIVAISYLDFAKSLRYTNPEQAILYMAYSKEMATISKEIADSTLGEKFGLNSNEIKISPYSAPKETLYDRIFTNEVTLLFSGILAGMFIFFILAEKKLIKL